MFDPTPPGVEAFRGHAASLRRQARTLQYDAREITGDVGCCPAEQVREFYKDASRHLAALADLVDGFIAAVDGPPRQEYPHVDHE